jgi:hypothetical protein
MQNPLTNEEQVLAEMIQVQPVTVTLSFHPLYGLSMGVIGRPSPRALQDILLAALREASILEVSNNLTDTGHGTDVLLQSPHVEGADDQAATPERVMGSEGSGTID